MMNKLKGLFIFILYYRHMQGTVGVSSKKIVSWRECAIISVQSVRV